RLSTGLTDVRLWYPKPTRDELATLEQVRVRASNGMLVPLDQIATFTQTRAPIEIDRRNRERIVTVSADVDQNANVSLGTLLANVDKQIYAPGFLPAGVHVVPASDTDAALYNQTFQSMGIALLTSFALVYMLMVILYGSFLEPFVVMFSVPVAIVGALGALALRHQTLNLFSLIAIVMLFGLVAKNGILLVDYANQVRRRLHVGVVEAMRTAAAVRFRPIVMTTCAMVFGMFPLSLGLTEGAQSRSSMGTVLIGGLLSSLVLTLALVPVMYTYIMGWVERRDQRRGRRTSELVLPEFERPSAPVGAAGD
ncbi:MAG: efflux RND transporter permease subunit, partial [Candidatus Dormibacteria bacterium]